MTSEHEFRKIIGRHIDSGERKDAEIAQLRAALKAIEEQTINLTAPSKPIRDRAINDIKRWSRAILAKIEGE